MGTHVNDQKTDYLEKYRLNFPKIAASDVA